jgi:hypothetical protein
MLVMLVIHVSLALCWHSRLIHGSHALLICLIHVRHATLIHERHALLIPESHALLLIDLEGVFLDPDVLLQPLLVAYQVQASSLRKCMTIDYI